jgi:hypothetical protein
VDAHLLRFSQAYPARLAAQEFLLQQPLLVALPASCLALSAALPAAGPFRLLRRRVLIPLHLLTPRLVEDDPTPQRFVQALGAAFLSTASGCLVLLNASIMGWTLWTCSLWRWLA